MCHLMCVYFQCFRRSKSKRKMKFKKRRREKNKQKAKEDRHRMANGHGDPHSEYRMGDVQDEKEMRDGECKRGTRSGK